MTLEGEYYDILTRSDDPCEITRDALEQAQRWWVCPGCRVPKVGTGPIDLVLEHVAMLFPLNFVQGIDIGVAQRRFLAELGSTQVEQDLHVGRVLDESGIEIKELASFHGKDKLTIRGNAKSTCHVCEVCGRIMYFPFGQLYLAVEPPQDRQLFGTSYGSLIVTGPIYNQIVQQRWPKLRFRQLPVLREPRDGRPVF